jgi:hypothetical protein
MAVDHHLVFAKIGEGGIKGDISGEGLIGGPHEWIRHVVAYAGKIAETYQLSLTTLRAIATDSSVGEMSRGKTELRPTFDGGSRRSVLALNVGLEGTTVIE